MRRSALSLLLGSTAAILFAAGPARASDAKAPAAPADKSAAKPAAPASKPAAEAKGEKADGNPVVVLKTSMGEIQVELDPAKAPVSVANFLKYVDAKHYDGTIFHRVIGSFMIQGGGFTPDMQQKPTMDPIALESANGLSNTRGTIAMARTNVPDSATAQFFINVVDNAFLNYKPGAAPNGYAVFGKVVSGMDVVDKIKAVKTANKGGMADVPVEPVVIESARRAE